MIIMLYALLSFLAVHDRKRTLLAITTWWLEVQVQKVYFLYDIFIFLMDLHKIMFHKNNKCSKQEIMINEL